jgi:hypothetical protein
MAEMKTCGSCGETKPLDAFNKNRTTRDGRQSMCRPCIYKYNREWRRRNPEKHWAAQVRWRQTSQAHREAKKRQKRTAAHRARRAVGQAVAAGRIVKPDRCEDCLSETPSALLHGHHEDYTRRLDVIWLCAECHVARHRQKGDFATPHQKEPHG